MTEQQQIAQRRTQLLVELFLGGLKPAFGVTGGDTGYDYLVGFTNRRGGTNFCIVEYVASAREVHGRHRMPRADLDRMANANVPVLFLVVDQRRERIHYAWPADVDVPLKSSTGSSVSIPVSEVDEVAKRDIRRRMAGAAPARAAVA